MDKFLKCIRLVNPSTEKECKDNREDLLQGFDSLLAKIFSLEEVFDNLERIQSGLRFLKMFVWSFSPLDPHTVAEIRHLLILVNLIPQHMWEIHEEVEDMHDYESWILDLLSRIQICKQKFEEPCELHLQNSLRCNPLNNSSNTTEFLAAILQNLKDLYMFKADDEIILLNNQIATLKSKVTLLYNVFNSAEWRECKELQAFKVVVHVFAQYSASLVFLFWVKTVDEEMVTRLDLLLFNVLHKYKPCVSAFTAVYIRFLKEMKSRRLDSLRLGRIVQSFLDLLLENLIVHISIEDFETIQESLFFVLSFLATPPDEHVVDEELMMMISAETDLLVKKDLFRVLSFDYRNGNFSEANVCIGDFVMKAELVKGKIQQVYDLIRDSFSYDFPKINGLGFFNFLLQNLSFLNEKLKKDKNFIPFAKNLIIQIVEELLSLRPYLEDIFERQKEHKQLKDTWLKVIDLSYKTEYAINSCLVASGDPLWYNMARLMEVLDKLKDVNCNLKKIEGRKTHDDAILHRSAVTPNRVLVGHPSASSFNEVMVGLEEEADKLVENLNNGSKSLGIVAIVGMPGLGKTTMVNKVYNAPAVRNHFHVFGYCVVSQVYSTRRILVDILGDIRGKDDKMYDMEEGELAHMLLKSLLGKRYLIIMDDIWDVHSWDGIKGSLPDNRNGSKVIFTTRIHNVALLAKGNCILHHLRFLSHEESWELLQSKAFQAESCSPDLLKVGKMIAKKCKGLPLTIVLIAGLLRTERSLSWWNKISEAVSSYVLTEDVMSVLEFSYQHLPEHLKPCFLYFGTFVEDANIRVNKLSMLWIAEGFVLNSKRENLENMAREYLNDLVGRSLVIANKRSSYGGIKSCRIHDLVHEFCQSKAREENIFLLKANNTASNSSSSTLRNPYRLCNHAKRTDFDARNICPSIRSLLLSCKWGINSHDRYDLSNLKLVQVMDLEELDDNESFMREMHSVVNLRFMSISCSPGWSFQVKFLKLL